ncbi:MAG TPA: DUF47 domain-containing protein [Candidatus Altiarchaeales archaeon]|nr:DUF47 domain-containing protein [Candidatus Altiarchaeales archaeon]
MIEMKLSEMIPYIGKGLEEETMKLIKEHAEVTYEIVLELKNALKILGKDDKKLLNEKVEEISSMESKADRLRRKVEENMYSGAFLPVSRSRILDLAENIDNIADVAQGAARLLLFVKTERIDKNLIKLLDEELDYGLKSVYLLKMSIPEIDNTEKVRNLIKEIRRIEHTSDIIEGKALHILYSREHEPSTTILLHNLIKSMGDISDRAEDASDALSLIVMMHTA